MNPILRAEWTPVAVRESLHAGRPANPDNGFVDGKNFEVNMDC